MEGGSGSIYSIGHGARKIDDFIGLLKAYGVSYVVDVRSKPRSRFNPQYNQRSLQESLKLSGIRYVYMGGDLGGLPDDGSCYDSSGHVDYSKVGEKDFFKEGIARLLKANEKKLRIACMCSELDACDCHRSKLIGEALLSFGISVLHISREGALEDQGVVMKRVLNKSGGDLFSDGELPLRSRKSYK